MLLVQPGRKASLVLMGQLVQPGQSEQPERLVHKDWLERQVILERLVLMGQLVQPGPKGL